MAALVYDVDYYIGQEANKTNTFYLVDDETEIEGIGESYYLVALGAYSEAAFSEGMIVPKTGEHAGKVMKWVANPGRGGYWTRSGYSVGDVNEILN